VNRDELVDQLAVVVAGSLTSLEAGRHLSPSVTEAVRAVVADMPVAALYDHDVLVGHLRQRLAPESPSDPRFPADRVALNFDGELLAVRGELVHGASTHVGGVFTYAVESAFAAKQVHLAWRAWVDARARLGLRPSRSERDHAYGLELRWRGLLDELEVRS
jgi:hypothetical protein